MKTKIKRSALVSILFIIALIPLSAQAAPVISIEPSHQNILQGDFFTVNITVDPAGDEVMGAQYDLYFNNMLLNATDQVSGTFLSHDGASTMIITNEVTTHL